MDERELTTKDSAWILPHSQERELSELTLLIGLPEEATDRIRTVIPNTLGCTVPWTRNN